MKRIIPFLTVTILILIAPYASKAMPIAPVAVPGTAGWYAWAA